MTIAQTIANIHSLEEALAEALREEDEIEARNLENLLIPDAKFKLAKERFDNANMAKELIILAIQLLEEAIYGLPNEDRFKAHLMATLRQAVGNTKISGSSIYEKIDQLIEETEQAE